MRLYRRGGKYWIDLRDPTGTRRRLPALESKRASEAFARNLEALRDCRTARERPDKMLLQWIEGLTADTRARLLRYGFIDGERAHAAQGLEAHLADYEADMRARECDPRHVKQEISKIRRMMQGCGFKTHSDIRADKLQRWLGDRREKDNMGARTANSYATAFKSFLLDASRPGERQSAGAYAPLQRKGRRAPRTPRHDRR